MMGDPSVCSAVAVLRTPFWYDLIVQDKFLQGDLGTYEVWGDWEK